MESSSARLRATPWFVLCTAVAALYLGREFLAPLALAVFLAFVFAPLVRSITHRRVPRVIATTLVLGGFAVVVSAIGWMFISQARSFADHLPDYRHNLRSKIADVRQTYGNSFERAKTTVQELGDELAPERALIQRRWARARNGASPRSKALR